MCTGFDNTDDLRKTFVIDSELTRLKVDIAALQETRLADAGMVKEANYTFFWQGLRADEHRLHGVGFAVSNRLLSKITTPQGKSERLISMQLTTKNGTAHIISAYAPTLAAESDQKDKFYQELKEVTKSIPTKDQIFILGDFNARVGADHHAWSTCLGQFGMGKVNENGQRLLEFCADNNMCITNTYYNGKGHHKVSWRHPRSGHWHQIDFIITRRDKVNSVKATRSYHSADCNTDHLLIIAKTKISPRPVHRAQKQKKPKINVGNASNHDMKALFQRKFKELLPDTDGSSPDEMWTSIKTAIFDSATEAFGTTTESREDWIAVNASTLIPLIEEKRKAFTAHNKGKTDSTLNQLRAAKSKLQRESRRCANSYWENLCTEIQQAFDTGDTKKMYEKIRVALGPQISKLAPLKSSTGQPISEKSQQMARWKEHYSGLYSHERAVEGNLEETIPQLPEMTDLDVEPTEAELATAIGELQNGKSSGQDNIPPEILRENSASLLPDLYKLLITCWRHGVIPHDMRNANIVTLYKNKGDKGDCNNYRGISLLSITGKVFARIILRRLQKLADRVLPESQCGFRSKRSTVDMIFSLRQLQEKCREQHLPLHMAFVDLTKAFDTVSRSGLYMVLKRIGCPPVLHQLIVSFHEDMKGTVQFDGSTSDSFDIRSGVKQGCVLAPTLFSIYFAVLLQQAFKTSPGDVFLHWRTDGSLFNLARLRAKTKTKTTLIRDLLFADDAAIVAHSATTLQTMMDQLSEACKAFSLVISVQKTVILSQDGASQCSIELDKKPLESVNKFCYLGSVITSSTSLDDEINARIGKAGTSYGKLSKRAWNNKMLTIKTKVRIYEACVLSTLLYGSEAWTTYSGQEKKLNTFHLRCLRKILGIRWEDRITNTEVLEKANLPSIFTILCKRRLRWLGHVTRMDDTRIPKQMLFGQMAKGTRTRGRPKLRFKDKCKSNIVKCSINPQMWEKLAKDRATWKLVVSKGTDHHENNFISDLQAKRQRRKQNTMQSCGTCLTCKFCNRTFSSNIGRISHERSCKL